jgi:hypothetical protein
MAESLKKKSQLGSMEKKKENSQLSKLELDSSVHSFQQPQVQSPQVDMPFS